VQRICSAITIGVIPRVGVEGKGISSVEVTIVVIVSVDVVTKVGSTSCIAWQN
jgi:hypothetical protein